MFYNSSNHIKMAQVHLPLPTEPLALQCYYSEMQSTQTVLKDML